MAYDIMSLESDRKNLGVGRYPNIANLGRLMKICAANIDQQFATAAAAETQSGWVTAIKNKTITPFPISSLTEPKGKEASFKEFPQGGQMKTSDGSKGWDLTYYYPFQVWKKFKTWDGKKGKFYLGYQTGLIMGYSPDGTKFEGFNGTIYVQPYGETDGSDTNFIKVTLVLDNIDDLEKAKTINPSSWKLTDLDAIHDVNVTVVTAAASSLKVRVAIDGFSDTDPSGQVTGLVNADFIVLNGSGVAQAHTTTTDNGDGTYTITPTSTFATGTVNLTAVGSISLTTLYIESLAAATVTIA